MNYDDEELRYWTMKAEDAEREGEGQRLFEHIAGADERRERGAQGVEALLAAALEAKYGRADSAPEDDDPEAGA